MTLSAARFYHVVNNLHDRCKSMNMWTVEHFDFIITGSIPYHALSTRSSMCFLVSKNVEYDFIYSNIIFPSYGAKPELAMLHAEKQEFITYLSSI